MGLILSYMVLILGYVGLLLSYMGLILTYVRLILSSMGLILSYIGLILSYMGLKTKRPKCHLMKLKNLMQPAPWDHGRIKFSAKGTLIFTKMDIDFHQNGH